MLAGPCVDDRAAAAAKLANHLGDLQVLGARPGDDDDRVHARLQPRFGGLSFRPVICPPIQNTIRRAPWTPPTRRH